MEYVLHVLVMVCIYGILAISFNLLVGFAGLFAMAQAAFYAFGAYSTAILTLKLGLPFPIDLLIGVAVTAFIGALVAIPAIRISGTYPWSPSRAGRSAAPPRGTARPTRAPPVPPWHQDPLPAGETGPREQGQQDGQIAQRYEEHQRHDQPTPQIGHPRRVGPGSGRLSRLVRSGLLIGQGDLVTGGCHRLDQAAHRNRFGRHDQGLPGREINGGRGTLPMAFSFFLHPGRARRAGHSLDGEPDLPRRG